MSSVEDDDEVDSEIQMFQNAFSGVGQMLWAQNGACSYDLFDTIAELKELFIETGYSKVLFMKITRWYCGLRTPLICLRNQKY
jgi:hypothetical protein